MNERRFDQKGTVYAKARPRYPDALFAYMHTAGLVSAETVTADIGAGTGIFSAQLAPLVKQVFAIEPNADMRSKADYGEACNVVSIGTTAEQTSLPDRSVDLVTVAQAFHWFDKASCKAEWKRILKPHGKVLLVWNNRNESSEIIRANYEVNRRYCPAFKGSSNGFAFDDTSFTDFFEGKYEIKVFENGLFYDRELFISRNLSSSYAPKPFDAQYADYVRAIGELFDRYQRDGTVFYPYVTRCYIGSV